MVETDQSPPPGDFFRNPGAAGPEARPAIHQQQTPGRIAVGLEGPRDELAGIKTLLGQTRL